LVVSDGKITYFFPHLQIFRHFFDMRKKGPTAHEEGSLVTIYHVFGQENVENCNFLQEKFA
jgi:hypothetical protein